MVFLSAGRIRSGDCLCFCLRQYQKCCGVSGGCFTGKGQKTVLYDLARCDKAKAVADAFRYDRLVLAGITYNGDLFPCMRSFIEGLTERNYQNRKVAIIENGTWAPMAGKLILGMFEKVRI